MNGNTFQWVLSGSLAATLALVGVIYTGMDTRISDLSSRLNRTNNRLNGACERIALLEYQLNMRAGTCISE